MGSLLLAFQFLTILPIKINEFSEKRIAVSAVYFPLVGLSLGLLLAAVNVLLTFLNLPAFSTNIILVVFLILITGGIHLDGLADSADAFLSARPKNEMLQIMRDPHIGVMGVLTLICAILLKIGMFSSISTSLKENALVLMCVLSRWGAVLSMFLFPYARQEGKAKIFIEGMNLKIFIISSIIAIICAAFIWQVRGLILLLIVTAFVYGIGKLICSKINGITGDTLGATIELSEIVILLSIFFMEGGGLWSV